MYQAESGRVSDAQSVFPGISMQDDQLATRPVLMVQAEQALSEEELYHSFEQAISVRLQRLYSPLPHALPHTTEHEQCIGSVEVAHASSSQARGRGVEKWLSLLDKASRHNIILVSLALLLMLVGFDLMGVLILFLRIH